MSQPTVIRFCRSLGFRGLADFQARLGLTGTLPVQRNRRCAARTAPTTSPPRCWTTPSRRSYGSARRSTSGGGSRHRAAAPRQARQVLCHGQLGGGGAGRAAVPRPHPLSGAPTARCSRWPPGARPGLTWRYSSPARPAARELARAASTAVERGAAVIAITAGQSPLARRATVCIPVEPQRGRDRLRVDDLAHHSTCWWWDMLSRWASPCALADQRAGPPPALEPPARSGAAGAGRADSHIATGPLPGPETHCGATRRIHPRPRAHPPPARRPLHCGCSSIGMVLCLPRPAVPLRRDQRNAPDGSSRPMRIPACSPALPPRRPAATAAKRRGRRHRLTVLLGCRALCRAPRVLPAGDLGERRLSRACWRSTPPAACAGRRLEAAGRRRLGYKVEQHGGRRQAKPSRATRRSR